MRSNKRYSNVPFTKRVDYDGGAHRGTRAAKGARVCGTCGAAFIRRRWVLAADPRARALRATAETTTCPACYMAREGQVGGYLRLVGGFVKGHAAELRQCVARQSARAAEDNPLARVLRIDRARDGTLTIATTTEHLVERLGRAVKHAFGGTIDYGFSHGNKFARATWRRD